MLTLPVAGLVNHRVQSWANGCLTLKLSLSWNTVVRSPSLGSVAVFGALSPSGEMGMVVRSTCSDIVAAG